MEILTERVSFSEALISLFNHVMDFQIRNIDIFEISAHLHTRARAHTPFSR